MQMETNCQPWFQVSIRTWFLRLYHLHPRLVLGKLTEWNTSQDPFPLAKSLLLPVQSVIKPVVLAGGVVLSSPKEGPTSTTPPIEISSSRLTKLTRRTTDRKSELLKTLKDDRNGDFSEGSECVKLEDSEDHSTYEPKENGEEGCHQNWLALPVEEEGGGVVLSHSLEAEHRLLKAIGWQEYPENDENFLPLTEDELREVRRQSS